MALYPNTRSGKRNGLNPLNRTVKLKCLQANLQHSRVATSNLTQIIQQYNTDIVFVQELYTVHNRVAGFPKGLKILTQGEGRIRAAILINNNEVDAITITQGSHEDAILTEIRYKGLSLRASLCPWDNRGKANSWRPPIHKNVQKCKVLQSRDEFIELTVGTSRVFMSKATTNNICSNKHKAQREYTYVNTKTHQNRLKLIQPNKKNPLRLFSFANKKITVLQCYVLMCGRSVTAFLAPLEVSARGKGPAHPTQRPALLSLFGASLYMPIDRDINIDLNTMENIIQYTIGERLILALDSNATSKL
jgi:hypothetical protein